jgi:hypothetical protein
LQPLKAFCIFNKFGVLKLERSIEVKEEQPLNMELIISKFIVLKLERSIDVKEEQE